MRRPSKGDLLGSYAARTPKKFVQVDRWYSDTVEENDGINGDQSEVYELMRGSDVRALINPEITRETAAMLLRNIADWVENDVPAVRETVGSPELNDEPVLVF